MYYIIPECLKDKNCSTSKPLCDIRTGDCMEGNEKQEIFTLTNSHTFNSCNFHEWVILILTFPNFTDVEFQKIENKLCSYHYEAFNDTKSAEESCRRDSSCKGVYDWGCDESPDEVYLCKVGYEYAHWTGDCIYDKKGEF